MTTGNLGKVRTTMARTYDLRTYEKNKGKQCEGPDCTNSAIVKGLCHSHYYQVRRGTPLRPLGTKAEEYDVTNIPGIGYETDAE